MIDPLSLGLGLGAGVWICGSGWLFADIADGPIMPPKWIAKTVATIWPIALALVCILWVGGLVWHVVKNLAVEAWDAIKGIFNREGV